MRCKSVLAMARFLLLIWLLLSCGCVWPGSAQPVSYGSTPSPELAHTYIPLTKDALPATVVIGDTQFPQSPDPLFANTSADSSLQAALWASPIYYDQFFRPHADQLTEVPLPENGDVRDGGLTVIMHLRHDLRWSDRQPLLARDFLYWWQLNQNPDTGAITVNGYDQIARIEIPDDYTVILHMKRPFGPYLLYLPYAAPLHAWNKFQPIDLQNRREVFAAPQVTDGPYMLEALQSNQQRYVLQPNFAYHSTSLHGPFLHQLVYQGYRDVEALVQAVRLGKVQVAQGYLEDDLPRFEPLPGKMQTLTISSSAYEHLDFNNQRPYFQDVRVRQAIQLGIDTCGLLESILKQSDCRRQLGEVEPLPSPVFDAQIKPVAYDPVQARRLLAEAGWSQGKNGVLQRQGHTFPRLRLVTTDESPLRLRVAAVIQHDLEKLGFTVQVVSYPLDQFFGGFTRGGILSTGAYDLSLFAFLNGPDPDDEYAVFHSSQIPTATAPDLENYAHVHDPLLDQWLSQARYTTSSSLRKKLYQQFLVRLAEQVYTIPLYSGVSSLQVSRGLRNVIPLPDLVPSTWNVGEWWAANPL